ncbi:MAG: hypothetical protein Q7T20_18395 [Saprospiraceae bacterium]|nr:hypothetical protein [Saprospiraceae bacterium]
MSNILKKFKSVFVVEEESAGAQNAGAGTQHPAEMTSPPSKPSSPAKAAPAALVSGSVSDKFVEVLAAALEKNNQDGFDYFEFRQSLKNLAKMPMDEQTRYQSAYAMAQTMGVTSAKLIESAKHYLAVLNVEQTRFSEAHSQQKAKLIGNREGEAKNLEAAMQQKAEQIKQLTQEIEQNRHRSEQIRKEINESTVKIETTKADFEATFSNVVAQIQDDVAKIQQHLK